MPPLDLLLPLLAFLMAIGAFAGVMAGLLGVGGGIILVPAFYYTFETLGFESAGLMQVCLATSLATIIVTSLRSLLAHNKKGAVRWDILRGVAPGIVVGAAVGVLVVSALRSSMLMAIFGVLGVSVGLWIGLSRSTWRLGDDIPGGLVRLPVATVMGFLSVLMGIGGGSLGVPFMTLYGVSIHRAVATAAGFGMLIAVPAVTGFLLTPVETAPPWTFGAVNLPGFAVIVTMTFLTAPIGARLGHSTDAKRLKRIFGVFLIVVSLNMLRKALMM